MDIQNETPFETGYFIGPGPERQPYHVVIVKATFALPEDPRQPVEAVAAQLPVVSSDEYYKGDVTGSVYVESDLVSFKPRADVVVFGTAYAPAGRAVKALDASLRVGSLRKTIRVFGDRRWSLPSRLAMMPVMSDPEPFTTMPLIDERAFGGFTHKGQAWCSENMIGRGIIGKKELVDGALLPNLENPRNLIQSWKDEPHPTGFGWRRKDTDSRRHYQGTFSNQDPGDENFRLPKDFQHDFYNGAHPDLQVAGYLRGDEEVELQHLTPGGYVRFRLPGIQPRVTVHPTGGGEAEDAGTPSGLAAQGEPLETVLDTLVFLPDEGVFYQVWRGSFPALDFEDDTVLVIR